MKATEKVKSLPAARSCLYGVGLDKTQMDRPLVAIVYAHNEICPGHYHLDKLAESVRRGIEAEGGTGIRMNAGVGVCDGIAMGHEGMKYSLPGRELNRDAVVDMVRAHGVFEGVVYIGACDKNIPGYLMAAASMKDLPGIFVTTGPMMPGYLGEGKRADVVSSFAADAQFALKKINEQQYNQIMEESCPGPGSCAGLFTANSMACVTEALGLTVPGMATAHAVDNRKLRMATESGRQVMRMIKNGHYTLGDILNERAFYNALVVDMAIGASTNTVLHVPAIAREAGYEFDLDRINEISSKTPNILRLSPAGDHRMIDFDRAGGIPVVMKRLCLEGLLDDQAETVTGSLTVRINSTEDNDAVDVIKSAGNPYSKTGGIAIYRGNLAPNGAVIKESGVSPDVPRMFRGTARVFDDEQDATAFIKSGKVQKGDVLVIRYEGPAGGPGMSEMLYPTSAIKGLKMDKDVALITDGRFSGGTAGICIGHVEPEAYNGGPIALLQNGDSIIIDMDKREINADSSDWHDRQINWKKVDKPVKDHILKNYRKSFTK